MLDNENDYTEFIGKLGVNFSMSKLTHKFNDSKYELSFQKIIANDIKSFGLLYYIEIIVIVSIYVAF